MTLAYTTIHSDPFRLSRRVRLRIWLRRQRRDWGYALRTDLRHPLRAHRRICEAQAEMLKMALRHVFFGDES